MHVGRAIISSCLYPHIKCNQRWHVNITVTLVSKIIVLHTCVLVICCSQILNLILMKNRYFNLIFPRFVYNRMWQLRKRAHGMHALPVYAVVLKIGPRAYTRGPNFKDVLSINVIFVSCELLVIITNRKKRPMLSCSLASIYC